MNTIVVAVDGSQHATKALDIAALLAKSNSADVMVVHAISGNELPEIVRRGVETEYADEIATRLKSANIGSTLPDETQYARTLLAQSNKTTNIVNTLAGENILKRAVSYLHKRNIVSVSSHLATNDAVEAILDVSKKHDADTIVMGCRGTGRLRGMVLGSVSQSVAHQANCSVVIVK